jgi:hypothetical protein
MKADRRSSPRTLPDVAPAYGDENHDGRDDDQNQNLARAHQYRADHFDSSSFPAGRSAGPTF